MTVCSNGYPLISLISSWTAWDLMGWLRLTQSPANISPKDGLWIPQVLDNAPGHPAKPKIAKGYTYGISFHEGSFHYDDAPAMSHVCHWPPRPSCLWRPADETASECRSFCEWHADGRPLYHCSPEAAGKAILKKHKKKVNHGTGHNWMLGLGLFPRASPKCNSHTSLRWEYRCT